MIDNLDNIKIFADGADFKGMLELNENKLIKGFTTNPTLMKNVGVEDYNDFAKKLIKNISNEKSISFEVFADDIDEMNEQAKIISSWGENVYVKIPITNTKGISTNNLVKDLLLSGVKCSVTAIFTFNQLNTLLKEIGEVDTPLILSVFAGRIADTGIDPMTIMKECSDRTNLNKNCELLWASPRELLNIFQAIETKTDIITVPINLLSKLESIGKDLNEFSLDTVKMFFNDASNAGYKIK